MKDEHAAIYKKDIVTLVEELTFLNSSVLDKLNKSGFRNISSILKKQKDINVLTASTLESMHTNYKALAALTESLQNASDDLEKKFNAQKDQYIGDIIFAIREESKRTFSKSIRELYLNSQEFKQIAISHRKAIELHNKSIKSFSWKITIASFIIGIFIGIASITIFQVNSLKNIILKDDLLQQSKLKNATKELKEEKLQVAKKYNLSKHIQNLLNQDVHFVRVKSSEFITVPPEKTKNVYISDQGFGVIALKKNSD